MQEEQSVKGGGWEELHQKWAQVHPRTYHRLWQVNFDVSRKMALSPRPIAVSEQNVLDARYHSDGRYRQSEDHCYFCYTLSGEGIVRAAGVEVPVPAGQAFLIKINDPQAGYRVAPKAAPEWRILAFEFTGLAAEALVGDLRERYGSVYPMDPHLPVLQRLRSFEAQKYAIVHAHAVDGIALVLELLTEVAAAARAQEKIAGAQTLVERAMTLVQTGSDLELTVEALADGVGVTRECLARAFRRHLDRSPHEVIRQHKIRHACFLLKDTDLPVTAISAQVGYADHTNFIRAFRQVTGVTPRQFRLHGSITLI